MVKKVLIVDDDQEMLKILQKDLLKYSRKFSVLTAENGLAAVEMLKNDNISLIITDLEMPQMDGLALLDYLKKSYPDIPAIVITDSGIPKEQKLAKEKGAAGYIEKPFIIEDLAKKIVTALKKEDDGGVLHGISPGTFLQLVEMEEKTCTIRLTDDISGNQGVLFFKKGELLAARLNELQGKDAAYKILAWEEATLSIQESCSLEENTVQADLQALLLEAMRLKDEVEEEGPGAVIEVKEPEIVIEEKPISEVKVEPEIVVEEKKSGIVLELEKEKAVPAIDGDMKKPSSVITEESTGSSSKTSELRGPSQTSQVSAKEDVVITYSMSENVLGALIDLRDFFWGSSFVKFISKAILFIAIVGIVSFSYLYITLESDKDLLKQIGQTKALIRSQQETLFQIDEEIKRLYIERDEGIQNSVSEVLLMELGLKISGLEDKQEKIETETMTQKEIMEDCLVKLESIKRKTVFERISERLREYIL